MVESITLTNEALDASLLISQSVRDYVLKSVDWGVVESSRTTYKYIDEVGNLVTNVTLESRPVSIVGWVVAGTKDDMTRRKKFLNKFVNPLHKITLQYDDYTIEGIADTSIRYGVEESENNEVMCKFMIDLFCPDPMFRNDTPGNVVMADWLPQFHFPLTIPEDTGVIMGLRMPSSIVSIENDGDVDCGFVVVFQATGTVTNPYIILIDTQETIKLDTVMEASDIIEVSTVVNKKTVTKIKGDVKTNAFDEYNFDVSTMFKLRVGTNNVRYGADELVENLLVNVRYSPEYLEVQQ